MDKDTLRLQFKELIDNSDDMLQFDDGSKSFDLVHQLINQCGYDIRAEQDGIRGTVITLRPLE